ncbi:MAG TPA: helix-turn-helix transcriptional regulator [Rhizomicrobium sp.]|jgi:predicted XRE-type DNA-binding protein
MKRKPLEVVMGSGNIFRDLGMPDANLLQLKALLASQVIRALNEYGLTVRQAEARTKIAAADFSRIRNANLDRFTVDRLLMILNRLGWEVDVTLKKRPRKSAERQASARI